MKADCVGGGLETKAVGIGDMYLAGGEEGSYLDVTDGEKSIKVKKGIIRKIWNFLLLFIEKPWKEC